MVAARTLTVSLKEARLCLSCLAVVVFLFFVVDHFSSRLKERKKKKKKNDAVLVLVSVALFICVQTC